jgi:hypothetical protein
MNKRGLRARLEKIEAVFSQRGLTEEAPVDISETLAVIASVRPDVIRLSEIDRKRWCCPDDPRGVLTDEEIHEEATIKLRILEKCALLGFPDGYRQRHYRKDRRTLFLLSNKEAAVDFIGLSAAEQAKRTIILARREALYEVGPKHNADLRILEIDGPDPFAFMERSLFEWHEVDHLNFLHPDEPLDDEEIASLDFPNQYQPNEWAGKSIAEEAKERLDEWHAGKGKDPRTFKGWASWMLYPKTAESMRRQNQRLAEMGFEPDTTTYRARVSLNSDLPSKWDR